MNNKLRNWMDDALFRIGLMRVCHYADLIAKFQRLEQMYNMATIPANQPFIPTNHLRH